MRTILPVCSVLLLASTNRVFAQDVNGILEGRLLDEFGKPTVGVNVIVESPNLQGVRATTTGEDGYFRLLALPIGAYSLHVRHVAVRQDARYLGSWRAVQI